MRCETIKWENGGSTILVELTERNLLTLLNELKRPGSARTLWQFDGDQALVVTAVPDETHYSDRQPGQVHEVDDPSPRTEGT